MLYLDTSYLVRFYLDDPGFESVRELGASSHIASCWHGRAEVLCALHRARREGRLNPKAYRILRAQFHEDCAAGAFEWCPLTDALVERIDQVLATAPATTFLRSADALHLACAAANGFREVYSNDRHLLAAAPLFGLCGRNILTA